MGGGDMPQRQCPLPLGSVQRSRARGACACWAAFQNLPPGVLLDSFLTTSPGTLDTAERPHAPLLCGVRLRALLKVEPRTLLQGCPPRCSRFEVGHENLRFPGFPVTLLPPAWWCQSSGFLPSLFGTCCCSAWGRGLRCTTRCQLPRRLGPAGSVSQEPDAREGG